MKTFGDSVPIFSEGLTFGLDNTAGLFEMFSSQKS